MNKLVHSSEKTAATVKTAVKTLPVSRTNDPARTMAGILEVATAEFANKGLQQAHDLLLLR
jgi:hypothetical protein